MLDNGEDIMVDLGLPLVFPGAGDGEPVLENGLLRFCDAILWCSSHRNQHVSVRNRSKISSSHTIVGSVKDRGWKVAKKPKARKRSEGRNYSRPHMKKEAVVVGSSLFLSTFVC